MLHFDILQNQWLILAMAGGLVLVLCMALVYLALWRPRPDGTDPDPHRPRGFIPALLILVYAVVAVFAVVYTWVVIRSPPNW